MLTELRAFIDPAYQAFTAKLVPTYPADRVLGVRIPQLRALAKRLKRENPTAVIDFCNATPHHYLEEQHLHMLFINLERDFQQAITMLEAFAPFLDNWATTDLCSVPVLAKHKADFLPYVRRWIADPAPFIARLGMQQLLGVYLKEDFTPEHLTWVTAVQSKEYYVEMMQAWYLSMAIVHHTEESLSVFEDAALSPFVRRMTIQKVRGSRQASPELKERVRAYR